MATVLLAVGLVLIVEGLVWALAPSMIEQMLEALKTLSLPNRRQIGLLAMVIGLIFLWAARALGA